MKKPQKTDDNLTSAYLMIGLWQQFGADHDGFLICDFMGAPEQAGEWLEDLGLIRDLGTVFELTKAGEILMDAMDHHSISRERINAVCEAIS